MEKPVIELDEVRRIAQLAYLELADRELERLTVELGAILAYMRKLEAVNIEGVPPTCHMRLQRLGLRPDEARPSLDRDVVLDQAPAAAENGFAVPTFVDEG